MNKLRPILPDHELYFFVDFWLAKKHQLSLNYYSNQATYSERNPTPIIIRAFKNIMRAIIINASLKHNQLIEHLHSFYNLKHLYVLTGISSSGKTTLLKSLKRKASAYTYIEFDKLANQFIFDYLKEHCTHDFERAYIRFGANIMHYIFCDKDNDHFWLKISLSEQKHYSPTLKRLAMFFSQHDDMILRLIPEKLKIHLHQLRIRGHKVVLDIFLNQSELNRILCFKPTLITIFKQFNDIASTIERRNQVASANNDPNEWRHPLIVYRQYSEIYSQHMATSSGDPLENLTFDDINCAVESGLKSYPYNLPRAFQNKNQFKKLILKNLSSCSEKDIKIYPRFWQTANRVINTSQLSKEQATTVAINFLRN